MELIEQLELFFEARKQELFYYSPFSFLRNRDEELLFLKTVKEPLLKKIKNDSLQIISIESEEQTFFFIVEHLIWDSNYFGFPTYKLHSILYEDTSQVRLTKAVIFFKEEFIIKKRNYCFTDIPSEDIKVLQALTGAGFGLIETKMTYYLNLNKHEHQRYGVREANYKDISNLRKVASEMRNPFDRFHADPIFETEKADEFLATFIEESIKGFADYTMLPYEKNTPPDAFLTAKYLKEDWPIIGAKASKMVLSAVSSKTCKGWYKKLISEMAYHLHAEGADYAFMHPASTNKAVIHTYETLGCKLGQVAHVFSCSPQL